MPLAVDQEALNDPSLKVLDILNPPTKQIPYAAFPKAVYLHPKDKTKDHRTKTVESAEELDAATKEGWRLKPHVPIAAADPELAQFEFEADHLEVKRGPGRPPNSKPAEV